MRMKKKTIRTACLLFCMVFLAVTPVQAATKGQKACAAYRKFMNSMIKTGKVTYLAYGEDQVSADFFQSEYAGWTFRLSDLNSDGVPELLVTGMFSGYQTSAFTFYKNKVVHFYTDDEAPLKFKGKKKIFAIEHVVRGYTYWQYGKLSKGKFVEVASRSESPLSSEYTYSKGQKTITKSKFRSILKKYKVTLKTKFVSSSDSYLITKANIKKYCK